jgi:hypothetical protein
MLILGSGLALRLFPTSSSLVDHHGSEDTVSVMLLVSLCLPLAIMRSTANNTVSHARRLSVGKESQDKRISLIAGCPSVPPGLPQPIPQRVVRTGRVARQVSEGVHYIGALAKVLVAGRQLDTAPLTLHMDMRAK